MACIASRIPAIVVKLPAKRHSCAIVNGSSRWLLAIPAFCLRFIAVMLARRKIHSGSVGAGRGPLALPPVLPAVAALGRSLPSLSRSFHFKYCGRRLANGRCG